MTIDSANLVDTVQVSSVSARSGRNTDLAVVEPSADDAVAAVATPTDPIAANAAMQAIQDHLSARISPPQFTFDYLSGLDVMTVRTAMDGEVVFQLPGPAAIRLAQLLKEGVPVESFGLLDKTA